MTDTSPLLEAQQKFTDAVLLRALNTEECTLFEALGRPLYSNFTAVEDSPPYHRAIVEGFLVNTAQTQGASEENPVSFNIVGNVHPGDERCPQVAAGEAIEVSTGSILPDGQYSIVRQWEAKREGDRISISRPFPPRFFIEDQGCDIKQGSTVIDAGTVLQPEHLATLASMGVGEVEVSRKPHVSIFASGDEVVPHTAPLRPGSIRDCNTIQLSAAVAQAGGTPQPCGIMGDDFDAFVAVIEEVLEDSDMIVISGGTAVGGRDFVSGLIREVGELIIDGVPMRSGRPLIMGIAKGKPIIAVAGHPPEALRGFRLFGEPALRKLLGQTVELLPG
ncbi:MAG TPA: molybdopterin molybdenumtransferase MoeA [Candidatus Tenderia sp.]|nr:molybdopterin molybdenumtransferase MoeA [Candidatus Tenderia sp.]